MIIMKKHIYILFIVLTMIISTQSCFNLDEEVFSLVTAESFGQTEDEVDAIIGPVYNTLKQYFERWVYISECSGDMAIVPTRLGGDWFDGGQYRDIHMHTWTSNTGALRNAWNIASTSISTCNLVYETVNSLEILTDENRASALAEIRGIRAFWVYSMMDAWGNIPLAVDFKDTELPATKTRQEVFDYIISELNDIKDILRSDVNSSNYGKFTKGAAYALLAKMYLNADAWGVNSGVTDNWQKVIDACDMVMSLGYQLEDNWKNNFITNNDGSKEAILASCQSYSDAGSYRFRIHSRTLHYKDNIALGASFTASNGICAQEGYCRLFDEEDKRLGGSFLMGEMVDPSTGEVIMTAHNRPLIHTIEVTQIPGSQYEGSIWGQVNQEDGYRCFKWEISRDIISTMNNDVFLIRYADIYLMKAEALVRKGIDNATATNLVNTIRERGFGNSSHNYSSVALDDIALERKLEFAWELMNRQDLIRFGTFQDARYLKPSTAGQDYKNIFPIPQTALDANSKLTQNPGY